LGSLRWSLFAQDGGRDQCDDQPDGKGLDKRHGCVEQRILVQHARLVDLIELRLESCCACPGGPGFGDQAGGIFVHEVVHEVEVDNLPGDHVKEAGDDSDGDADGKAFGRR
jgi:hypothetical protein